MPFFLDTLVIIQFTSVAFYLSHKGIFTGDYTKYNDFV